MEVWAAEKALPPKLRSASSFLRFRATATLFLKLLHEWKQDIFWYFSKYLLVLITINYFSCLVPQDPPSPLPTKLFKETIFSDCGINYHTL